MWLLRCGLFCCVLYLPSLYADSTNIFLETKAPNFFGHTGLTATNLAVIVNEQDPVSVEIANFYLDRRKIPSANLIKVSFDPDRDVMPVAEFEALHKQLSAQTPDHIQAYALTWQSPYRVDCMSITSAFALGYDPAYCAKGCKPTRPNFYANSSSNKPFDDFGIRPAMMLATDKVESTKALIERGIDADRSWPIGHAYLVETDDEARSVRSVFYDRIKEKASDYLLVSIKKRKAIRHSKGILFYFTGLKHVPHIDSNEYLPGAVADHLTSFGGIPDSSQMSAFKWLEAGATGSYGAVVEPCNFLQKFPHPGILIDQYLQGSTLIEAYWKSVLMPGQGLFIGEPLAAPYRL